MSGMNQRSPSELVAAVDMGASQVRCLIGRREADGGVTPLGVGSQTMRRGADCLSADFDAAARFMAVAADQAMRMSGAGLPPVMLSYGGPGLTSEIAQGSAVIGAGGVTAKTVEAAALAASRNGARRGARILGLSSVRFRIDGGPVLQDPVGQAGGSLMCEASAILAPEAAIAALEACAHKAGLTLAGIAATPVMAGEAVLTHDERMAGAVLIDFGASHTGLAVFHGGEAVMAKTLALGADRVTRALAQALDTTMAAAERVKIAHADLSFQADVRGRPERGVVEYARLSEDGRLGPGAASRAQVDTAARSAWLSWLTDVRAAIDAIDPRGQWPAAFCGGAALTPGLTAVVERTLGRRARLAAPRGFGVLDSAEGGPGYAAACGLLRSACDAELRSGAAVGARFDLNPPRLQAHVAKAWTWLRENL
jgi:cell division protein FtsA